MMDDAMPRRFQRDACPYEILGVTPEDDFATIRKAWRELVKTYHPDVWQESLDEATRRLTLINDAYDRLARVHKRERFQRAEAKAAAQEKPAGPDARKPAAPRPSAEAAERRKIVRAGRPNPAAGRFDAARRMFETTAEQRVQAFA